MSKASEERSDEIVLELLLLTGVSFLRISNLLLLRSSVSHLTTLNDTMKVRVQQLHDDVELVITVPHAQGFERDDVVVHAQVAHEPDLPEDMLGVLGVSGHGRDFLDGDLALRRGVDGRGDHAVAALSDGLELAVPAVDL